MTAKKKDEQSVEIKVTLKLGKGKKVTLDNNEARDLYYKLKEIYDKYYPYIIYTTPYQWNYYPYTTSTISSTTTNTVDTYTTDYTSGNITITAETKAN